LTWILVLSEQGEAPESYLCDLGDLVVQTVRLCELLYSTKDHNGAATTMNHRIGVPEDALMLNNLPRWRL
jgi:hypothetical protein